MNTPIVIDACTLINLLRIDEEDDFLYKYIKSLNVHITETVHNEVKRNILKNAISEVDSKRIQKLLPSIGNDFVLHKDEEIKRDVGTEMFEQIISYTVHKKKINGELMSSVLALILSRQEESKICFLTDDFPAKKELDFFFKVQQIGLIEDSIDLLLMLHWSKTDFSKKRLEQKLHDLKSEYNRVQNTFVKNVVKIKSSLRRGTKERNIIEEIERAYFYSKNMVNFKDLLDEMKNIKSREIKKCLDAFPDLSKQPELVNKAIDILRELDKIEIYKLV